MQKARGQAFSSEEDQDPPTACRHEVSGSISPASRRAFHLSLTVLVHYRSQASYLALADGPASFNRDFSCPGLLREQSPDDRLSFAYGALTLYGGAFQHASTHSNRPSEEPAGPSDSALQPRADNGCSLSRPRSLGSSPFARRYSGNHSFVFSSSGYLDVSVPRVRFAKPMYSAPR